MSAYNRTTWVTGDLITAAKMNNIETTLEAVQDGTGGPILYDIDQTNTITSAQAAQARENIGAAAATDVEQKAAKNGYYDGMSVGNAEQIIATTGVEDTGIYSFRECGGGKNVSENAEIEKLIGGTICFNQLLPLPNWTDNQKSSSGYTIVDNRDGSFTISGTGQAGSSAASRRFQLTTGFKTVAGHVIYINYGQIEEGTYPVEFVLYDGSQMWTTNTKAGYVLKTSRVFTSASLRVTETETTLFGDGITYRPQVIDLTMMFGAEVADAVYALESGYEDGGKLKRIQFLKSWFPKDYYPYDPGTLISVQPRSRKITGFNQWDEQWELGGIDTDGVKDNTTNKIRSKNYIPVVPNTQYYMTSVDASSIYVRQYDADYNFLGIQLASDTVFTTPDNCHYLMFACTTGYGTVYLNDICINLSSSRDGEYEAYTTNTYDFDSSLELKGIVKWNSTDESVYYDGDTYTADGTVQRRYGIVDLGTLNWSYNSSYGFYTPLSGVTGIKARAATDVANIFCGKYIAAKAGNITGTTVDQAIGVGPANIYVRDSSYSDAETFETAMDGVQFVYELDVPVTESAAPYAKIQGAHAGGSEQFIEGHTGKELPVGHTTVYRPDLRAKLEDLPQPVDLNNRISAIEGINTIQSSQIGTLSAQFDLALANIAPTFSESNNYMPGNYVIRYGEPYRFTSYHAAGTWTDADTTPITIGADLAKKSEYMEPWQLVIDKYFVKKGANAKYVVCGNHILVYVPQTDSSSNAHMMPLVGTTFGYYGTTLSDYTPSLDQLIPVSIFGNNIKLGFYVNITDGITRIPKLSCKFCAVSGDTVTSVSTDSVVSVSVADQILENTIAVPNGATHVCFAITFGQGRHPGIYDMVYKVDKG